MEILIKFSIKKASLIQNEVLVKKFSLPVSKLLNEPTQSDFITSSHKAEAEKGLKINKKLRLASMKLLLTKRVIN